MTGARRILIVGGVAGGMSAATRLRRLDESAEIVVFERGEYVSFANCGLPYFVGGVIEDRDALLLQTPESLAARFRLDVRLRHEVTAIDRGGKRVRVQDLRTGRERFEAYDALVLAPGAAPRRQGADDLPAHVLHTIDDVDAVTALLGERPAARVVVAGGGFIGLEAAENLRRRGAAVTLVQRGEQPLAPLDAEMAAPVVSALRDHGVDLRLGRTIASATPSSVVLDDGEELQADLLVEALGVRPDTSLAAAAGLRIGPAGGIAVDEFHRTDDPAVYAVGDAAEKVDGIDLTPTLVTMAGLANRHGRTVADAIAGAPVPSPPALGTAIIGVFDLTVGMVGWSERRLTDAGRPHRIVHVHPASHAAYYPGGSPLAVKLVIAPETDRILGAQVVGRDGVDKRIDVLATAMAAGIPASGLAQLELAYAPQYGSAKDAVNIAGYVAENLARGLTRSVQWHELDAALRDGASLIDVRSREEFARGGIPGAINMPLDGLREQLHRLPRTPLVVHCQVGQRGHAAVRLLTQLGYEAVNLDGGYLTWLAGMAARRHPEPVPA